MGRNKKEEKEEDEKKEREKKKSKKEEKNRERKGGRKKKGRGRRINKRRQNIKIKKRRGGRETNRLFKSKLKMINTSKLSGCSCGANTHFRNKADYDDDTSPPNVPQTVGGLDVSARWTTVAMTVLIVFLFSQHELIYWNNIWLSPADQYRW